MLMLHGNLFFNNPMVRKINQLLAIVVSLGMWLKNAIDFNNFLHVLSSQTRTELNMMQLIKCFPFNEEQCHQLVQMLKTHQSKMNHQPKMEEHVANQVWGSSTLKKNQNFSGKNRDSLIDTSWIIDTRASDHMVHSENLFSEILPCHLISIRLPKILFLLKERQRHTLQENYLE